MRNSLRIVRILRAPFGVSSALEGYIFKDMPWWQRIVSAAGGLALIYPGLATDLVGLGLIAVVLVLQFAGRKHARAV